MPKLISAAELAQLAEAGAEIRRIGQPDLSSAVDNLLAKVSVLADRLDARPDDSGQLAEAMRLVADAVTSLRAEKAPEPPPILLNPEIRVAPTQPPNVIIRRPKYTFRVVRDDRGRIETVEATPDGE